MTRDGPSRPFWPASRPCWRHGMSSTARPCCSNATGSTQQVQPSGRWNPKLFLADLGQDFARNGVQF